MLENEKIKLKAPEPEDLEVLYKWENDTRLWSLGSTLTPYSRYDLKAYIESSKDIYVDKQLRLMVETKPDALTVGVIDLYDFDPYHKRAAVGVIIDAAYQRKGLAGQALSLLCDYAFSWLKIHQLYAFIPVKNEPSKRLFLRAGFEKKGVLHDWLQTVDGYEDVLIVSLINGYNDSMKIEPNLIADSLGN